MPGDTKIKRSTSGSGWIDIDNPAVTYPSRRRARDARRNSAPASLTTTPSYMMTHNKPNDLPADTHVPAFYARLGGLQTRLFDRLTCRQGVTTTEAYAVIESNGYNAAASYGHMREAGATHIEALTVIGLNSPGVSLAYGIGRQDGLDHVDALIAAMADD